MTTKDDGTPPQVPTQKDPIVTVRAHPTTEPAQAVPAFEPSAGMLSLIEALLKTPNRVVATIDRNHGGGLIAPLAALVAGAYGCYGIIVGSFSGGVQWWASPAKIVVGMMLSGLICLPSLFIFSCLSGAAVRIRQVAVLMLLQLGLSAVLLVGFLPVAWVFSQSTGSTFFIGLLHLFFWMVGLSFGARLLEQALVSMGAMQPVYFRTWCVIFALTLLQMTTALRPILGTSDTFFPTEKRFFLVHWGEVIEQESKGARSFR